MAELVAMCVFSSFFFLSVFLYVPRYLPKNCKVTGKAKVCCHHRAPFPFYEGAVHLRH